MLLFVHYYLDFSRLLRNKLFNQNGFESGLNKFW